MDESTRVIPVEIHGQPYPIRTSLDAAYVAELAAYVDEKMRLAAREASGSDTLKVAVLAALNIADEYFRARAEQRLGHDQLALSARANSSACWTSRSASATPPASPPGDSTPAACLK
jgi:cell division protein ZapA